MTQKQWEMFAKCCKRRVLLNPNQEMKCVTAHHEIVLNGFGRTETLITDVHHDCDYKECPYVVHRSGSPDYSAGNGTCHGNTVH